jgi:NAD(P)-dependent dehydrogenase (short-subunit alcohol dehydrogenase family)
MAEQRRIVITGITRGLGLAAAAGFIERGHAVCGCGTSKTKIAELQTRWPKPHQFDVVDVADDRAVAAWANQVFANGPVDLLINNAAVMNEPAPLWNVNAEEFDRLMDVNVSGVVNMIRHFVPAMLKRKSGVIVNLSSGWGRSVSPEVAPYCASKFAIEGLTKALAADFEEHGGALAAIPLNPGIIDTDMLRQAWSDGAANYPKPEKWAERAVPFVLRLSAKDNGHSLTVPGG